MGSIKRLLNAVDKSHSVVYSEERFRMSDEKERMSRY